MFYKLPLPDVIVCNKIIKSVGFGLGKPARQLKMSQALTQITPELPVTTLSARTKTRYPIETKTDD